MQTPRLVSPLYPHHHIVSTTKKVTLSFEWEPIPEAGHYLFQLSQDQHFHHIVHQESTKTHALEMTKPLGTGSYHWRVRAMASSQQTSSWSMHSNIRVELKIRKKHKREDSTKELTRQRVRLRRKD